MRGPLPTDPWPIKPVWRMLSQWGRFCNSANTVNLVTLRANALQLESRQATGARPHRRTPMNFLNLVQAKQTKELSIKEAQLLHAKAYRGVPYEHHVTNGKPVGVELVYRGARYNFS